MLRFILLAFSVLAFACSAAFGLLFFVFFFSGLSYSGEIMRALLSVYTLAGLLLAIFFFCIGQVLRMVAPHGRQHDRSSGQSKDQ